MADLITNHGHNAGYTCLAFSQDGKLAFTGGDEGLVRTWKVAEGSDQEPALSTEAENGVTSIASSGDCWLAGGIDADVRRYGYDPPKFEGLVTSAKGVPVRCVAVDPRGKRVAVASDEQEIRLVELDDITKITLLKHDGHRSGVRTVSWHPTAPLLTSCGRDGQIIVWNVSKDEPTKEADVQSILPTLKNDEAIAQDCRAIWHPSGEYFFVPDRQRDIVSVRRSGWKKDQTFRTAEHGFINALALSPNGAYLVSAAKNMIYVWSTTTTRLVAKHSSGSEALVHQILFSPSENLLAWTTANGDFTRWKNPVTSPDPIERLAETSGVAAKVTDLPLLFKDDDKNPDLDALMNVDDNEEGEEEEEGDDDDDDAREELQKEPDWIEDDTAGPLVKEMGKISKFFIRPISTRLVSITKAQPAFQPGATPMVDSKCYLALNRIGKIEATAVATTSRYIYDVKFWDGSVRGNVHIAEDFEYNLADLGERGALFACKAHEGEPGHVLYKLYGNASPPQWKYPLRRNCSVLGIAAGGLPPSGNTRNLYDGDLDERRIMGLGGDFVSMVAGHEWVFVVHRAGSTTIDGSQNLSYTLINFDDFSVRQRDFLPIPKGHTLTWIGITDEGAPAMYDSTGRLHILTKYRIPHHASWARVMDTNLLERKVGKDESYWPIGISGNMLMCIVLKGLQTHPPYSSGLVHDELPIEMPFRSSNKAEEKIERDTILLEILRDALDDEMTNEQISKHEQLMDKDYVLLIQSACQQDNVPRAIELAKLIHNSKFLDSVIKISEFYHFKGLTEKIQTLKKIREAGEDRLLVAREKRRQWTRPDPLPRTLSAPNESESRPKPFQDFGSPPPVTRPGLQPARPVKETTRYTASPSIDMPPPSSVPSPPENKRKRDEVEELPSSFEFMAPAPKQKVNPFARKAVPDNGPNVFARKSQLNNIQKSDSFFEKVDAAPTQKSKRPAASKPKDREKQDGPRQTTLLGMMAKKKATVPDSSQPAADSDVTMTDSMTDSTLVETQPDSLPPDWEETQPVETEETQPV
ncbi:hypothetical protein FB45DRAFT_1100523 [Roridomyces roridus]|uniref:Minichromosome loss protein Mcl1 middle region domain-containing protein n=1 Tax=Roridomyces roridus TaxID=1738132 RepID=A0AAD7CHH2_9AGAR|nr:hypothetical protein FB45DRAFT_1100523 [Roridomyces roridus]